MTKGCCRFSTVCLNIRCNKFQQLLYFNMQCRVQWVPSITDTSLADQPTSTESCVKYCFKSNYFDRIQEILDRQIIIRNSFKSPLYLIGQEPVFHTTLQATMTYVRIREDSEQQRMQAQGSGTQDMIWIGLVKMSPFLPCNSYGCSDGQSTSDLIGEWGSQNILRTQPFSIISPLLLR